MYCIFLHGTFGFISKGFKIYTHLQRVSGISLTEMNELFNVGTQYFIYCTLFSMNMNAVFTHKFMLNECCFKITNYCT